jgi:ABC-type multidrug transport system permease subunit
MSFRQLSALVFADLKRLLRRRDTIVWLLIMPLPYIYFFGVAFRASPDQQTWIAVVAPEPDAGSQRFIQSLEDADYGVEVLETWPEDRSGGLRIDLPPRLGEKLLAGEKTPVTVHSNSGSTNGLRLEVLARKMMLELRAEALARLARGEELSLEVLAEPLEVVPVSVEVSDWGKKREVPSGMKQSIPGNMVMFVLMSVLVTGALRLLQDREHGYLQRLLAFPISAGGVVTAQFISLLTLGFAETAYFLLLGRFLFGQSLGSHPWAVFGIMVLMVAAASGVGVLIGSTLRKLKQATAIGVFVTLVLSALGGCWWPLEILPDSIKTAAMTLPTGQTMHAMVRLMVWDDSPAQVLPNALYLVTFALVSCSVSAWVLRKRLV